MADSTIQGLPSLTSPALDDLILMADKSDSYVPKKVENSKLRDLVLNNNSGFNIASGHLSLNSWMDANGMQIKNLGDPSADNDAVNYGLAKDALMGLSSITPAAPNVSDKGAALRISTSTISNPWGGFYMFYWCVDTSPSTTFSLSGDSPVASSGAAVSFDGSVANLVNVIKDSGWVGKYFHCCVRYRNIKSLSALSGTGHLQIINPAYGDLIGTALPDLARNPSLSQVDNRLCLEAELPVNRDFGVIYTLQLLFDDQADTVIQGNEPGLVQISSRIPSFTYDIPLSLGSYKYAHARVVSVSLAWSQQATDTVHSLLEIDPGAISETLINYFAARLSEKLVTNDDVPLRTKS
ncbi:hypothetical protein MASR1M36_09000 [Candidatus Cloacimonadaceae bacterium]